MGTGLNAFRDISMIVALLSDQYLRAVVGHAARLDEDVVFDPVLTRSALEWGFPRLVIREGARVQPIPGIRPHLPVLSLDRASPFVEFGKVVTTEAEAASLRSNHRSPCQSCDRNVPSQRSA